MNEKLQHWEGTNHVTDPTWGDNAKGKLVDLMGQRADLSARINGGPNSGHTVVNEYGEFKLRIMPSGIFNPEAICVIANTVVVSPTILAQEISSLRQKGIQVSEKNLLVARSAHLIMPWHLDRDNLRETSRGETKIGTTGQGIGPTYGDRSERVGLRAADLLANDFEQRLLRELEWQEKLVGLMKSDRNFGYDRQGMLTKILEAREIVAPLVTDVFPVIQEYHLAGKRVLGEAGQGMLLDLDLGGYPYVTSSHPGIAGFNLATGISPSEVQRVIAVSKVYTTRVGGGPLPTELFDETGDMIRQRGNEFGTVSGRPRRCGWLDCPTTRYGLRAAGATSVALTKLDIFDNFSEVGICIGHRVGNTEYDTLSTADIEFMQRVEPIIEYLTGWETDTTGARSFADLPMNAQRFVKRTQEVLGYPVELVSVGPSREASIYT